MPKRFLQTLTVLSVLALGAATCVGCVSAAGEVVRESIRKGPVRTPAAQKSHAVRVLVRCKAKNLQASGSGVIVSPTQILTATHVVEWCPDPELIAIPPGGFGRRMRVEMVSTLTDVARLRIADDGSFSDVRPLEIAAVVDGSRVCAALADPYHQRRCGFVEDRRPDMDDDLTFSAPIEPGNSGSGLYDSRGRLVGIVTAKTREHGRGIATSLAGREWLLDMVVTAVKR